MLFREDFGWRHDGCLITRLDRLQRGQGGDDGFAAADIALQQPLHRMRPGEVGADFREYAGLRPGEFERHRSQQRPGPIRMLQQGMRAHPAAPFVMQPHRQLLRQQLVELHPAPGGVSAVEQGLRVDIGRRIVQQPDRFIERQQFQFPSHRQRQRVRQIGLRQRAGSEFAQDFLAESCSGRIHRCHRLRQRHFTAQYAKTRMDHLRAEESLADLTHHPHLRTGRQCVFLARIEIEKTHHQPSAAVVDFRDKLTPRTEPDMGLDHGAFDLHGLSGQRVVDGNDAGFIFVAQRQVRDQIGQFADADARQLFLDYWGGERKRGMGCGRQRAGAFGRIVAASFGRAGFAST